MSITKYKTKTGWTYRVRVLDSATNEWHTSTHKRLKDAEQEEAKWKTQLHQGTLRKTDLSRKTSLRDYITDYLKSRPNLGRTDVGALLRCQESNLAKKRLAYITHSDVQSFVQEREVYVQSNTVKREMKALQALFNDVMDKPGFALAVNPVRKLKYEDESSDERHRVLEDGEDDYIQKAIDGDTRLKTEFKALYLLLSRACPRIGTCLKLYWKDASLDERVIRAPKSTTKNGREWKIVMPPVVVEAIRKMKQGKADELIFGKFWVDSSSFNQRFRRTLAKARKLYLADCEKNGVEPNPSFLSNLRVHDLRHHSITQLYKNTLLTTFDIMNLSGHLEIKSHERYVNLRVDQRVLTETDKIK